MVIRPDDHIVRFLLRVSVDVADCWVWTGAARDGYGQFQVDDQLVSAHRWAYEQFVGPIPAGWQIHHVCRNTLCVNPDPRHLQALSARDHGLVSNNMGAINARKTHCKRGHPFDRENTIVTLEGTRRCRACERARCRTRKRRQAASKPGDLA